jgi:hypothetical protein
MPDSAFFPVSVSTSSLRAQAKQSRAKRKSWIASSQMLLAMTATTLDPPPSYPRKRVSSTPRVLDSIASVSEYWMPACAGMTGRQTSAFSRRHSPEVCKFICPQKKRTQGRPGARCTRGLACQDAHSKKRTRAYRFSGSSPAFPAQWFYSLYRALPGETWLACHRHPCDAKHHHEFDTSHWGVRTTRLCCPPHAPFVKSASASIAPRPNVSDDGQRPLSRDGMTRNKQVICPRRKQKYF